MADRPDTATQPGTNRAIWFVIGAMIVIFVVAGIVVGKKKTPNVNSGTRAVILPTDDAARTVFVAPCGTGVNTSTISPATLLDTTGTIDFTLPQGTGERVVLVPRCAAATNNLPSAAFVLRPGTPVPSVTTSAPKSATTSDSTAIAAPGSAQSQLLVPNGSPVKTVVLAPCNSHSPAPAQRILAGPGATAAAPAC